MGSIRTRPESNTCYLDFRYNGVRCREQTTLQATTTNIARLERLLRKIEKEIKVGTFIYSNYFPNSKRVAQFESVATAPVAAPSHVEMVAAAQQTVAMPQTALPYSAQQHPGHVVPATQLTPTFKEFSNVWFREREIDWKRSNRRKVLDIMKLHLIPRFGGRRVGDITKADLLALRTYLAKDYRAGQGLSPSRINSIMNIMSQIIEEAADRYDFTTPYRGIKSLRVPRTKVDPFPLDEVNLILNGVREDFRDYYLLRFFTGMRTSEIDGLQWKYVDFDARQILIREVLVRGHLDTAKTDGSEREIDMSAPVFDALKRQHEVTGEEDSFVFLSRKKTALDCKNINARIWHPLLEQLEVRRRKPYQTRHTAATLWLAAGEAPEWIARQMGHTTTKMLFTTYSRYVPNLTRQDGSAMDQLLRNNLQTPDLSTVSVINSELHEGVCP